MFARFFPPPPDAKLTNEPATLVAALGGDLGDIAHDEAALERATALANGERGATFSPLLIRHSSCFGWRWTKCWAIVEGGVLRLYRNAAATSAFRTLHVDECECEVGERETCLIDHYCFRLQHATGVASFCALNSKQLLLWLQALQRNGVKYEEAPTDQTGISSLFQLRANLLSGEPVELSRYSGCVCLVVNAASK